MAAGKELDPVINTNEFAAVAAVAAETHVHSNAATVPVPNLRAR